VGILLLVLIVLVFLALTMRAWRGYEAAFRRDSSDRKGGACIGQIPGEPFIDGNSSGDMSHTQHGGGDCGGFHHGGCDVGHGGLGGGGHH
jgi:hypothetical protein